MAAVTDELGEVEYLVALVRDITEWRSAEEQNAQLFGFPLALIFIAGFDGYFKRVSAGYETLLGWTAQELRSRPYFEFVHPDDRAVLSSSIQRIAAEPSEVITRRSAPLQTRDLPVAHGNYSPVFDEGLMYGMAVDVTERKRAEEALRQSERRTRLIIDTAYKAFIFIDAEGRILEWNAEAERVFAWTREEALGRLLNDTHHPRAPPNRPCSGTRSLPRHRRGADSRAADRDRGLAPRRIGISRRVGDLADAPRRSGCLQRLCAQHQ